MSSFQLDVLFEDNHLIVVDKPPLIATMGTPSDVPSLADHVKDYLRDKYHKPGNVYLGVVSRLDSFVSGVIVFARTSKAAKRLNDQFRDQSTRKIYLAIVEGKLETAHATLEDWLVKNEGQKRMQVSPAQVPGAKLAKLQYKVLGEYANRSLVEIDLQTGRKHQIRVQLSALGHPVAGDRKYGASSTFARGIALHSQSVTIEHPVQKKPVTFESSPPQFWNLARFQGISSSPRRQKP